MTGSKRAELIKLFYRDGSRQKQTRIIFSAFVLSILCTTVAQPTLNIIFSFAAMAFLVTLCILSFQHLKSPVVWGLILVSLASGCTGPLLDDRRTENIALCQEILATSCREHTIEAFYILGIPTKDISRSAAVIEGQLNVLTVSDQVRGYGLIGLARVTVMGS